MTEAERKAIVLQYEGQALSNVGVHGEARSAEIARSVIDGCANALIRLEGREAASGFLFTLSDRVAGGLRQPTDFRALAQPEPALPAPEFEPPAPFPSSRKKMGWVRALFAAINEMRSWSTPTVVWPSYLLGLLHGAIIAFFILVARS